MLWVHTFKCYESTSHGAYKARFVPCSSMAQHKVYVREQALRNELVTHDTFVLLSNMRNLAKKRWMNCGKNIKKTQLV